VRERALPASTAVHVKIAAYRQDVFLFSCHSDAACLYFPMTTASKLMAAVAVSISMAAATQANAGEPLFTGYRHAPSPLPPAPPPVVVAQAGRSPPGNDVLDDIEGNSRGITRQEVEAALIDWCATHADAPLCVKLRVASPPRLSPPGPVPRYAPPPPPYYRGYSAPIVRYYRPGRFRTWNGCQDGWTVQDGLCKPYRGY
jgi:hypothetical protein